MNVRLLNILPANDDGDDYQLFKKAVTSCMPSKNFKAVHDAKQLMQPLSNETNKLPHILFLDLHMPRKNGFKCLAEIKKLKKLKKLPVIIFSTSGSQAGISKIFETGAAVYMRKPSNFKHLVQLIQHALPIAAENIATNTQLKYICNA